LNYDKGAYHIRLRVRPDDVATVRLRVGDTRIPLQEVGRDTLYATYSARYSRALGTSFTYTFELVDGSLKQQVGPFRLDSRSYRPFVVPAWAERAVFYQIFPDRFDNGRKENDPDDVMSWDANPTYSNRFGGDLAGIQKRIPYLAQLGVRSIYLNPVFASPSNHRYEADSYELVDPQLGSNAEFTALGQALKEKGMGLVMDLALNHTSPNFFAFKDIREKERASRYLDWYTVRDFPVRVGPNPNYEAWYGFPSMPKLNTMHPPTTEYLLSVPKFWAKRVPGLDGFRLDVANEVDMRFWRKFRSTVKSQDRNHWIVGEHWGDGRPWLGGDQWDSMMGYQFRDASLKFFVNRSVDSAEFGNQLMATYSSYPPQVSRSLMNLLSSHDTPRFLTLLKGDERMHRLAATVQMTWPGAPSIYYGEEIGMLGGVDPDNRRGMQWTKVSPELTMLRFYRDLIQVRNKSRALQSGDVRLIWAKPNSDAFAFKRTYEREHIIVLINRGSQPVNIPLTSRSAYQVIFSTGETVASSPQTSSFRIGPTSAVVLRHSANPETRVRRSTRASASTSALRLGAGTSQEHHSK
jgi:glycosidase